MEITQLELLFQRFTIKSFKMALEDTLVIHNKSKGKFSNWQISETSLNKKTAASVDRTQDL